MSYFVFPPIRIFLPLERAVAIATFEQLTDGTIALCSIYGNHILPLFFLPFLALRVWDILSSKERKRVKYIFLTNFYIDSWGGGAPSAGRKWNLF